MLYYAASAAVVCLAVAVIAHFVLHLSWKMVLAFFAVSAFVISPLVNVVGTKIAVDDSTRFHEYWNGYETRAYTEVLECQRDGGCRNTYSCDPYQVPVTRTRSVPDGKGGTRTETYVTTETRYHSCPYSSTETSYYVDSTLDSFTIARNLMTGEPWRRGESIPGGQVTEPPLLWTQADDRIKAGKPGPVTQVKNYTNYILASSTSLYERYSGQVAEYQSKGIMPKPISGIRDVYYADKLYLVGDLTIDQPGRRIMDVAHLNGAMGTDLRGDLHVVAVKASAAGSPDDYTNSLYAYWQSPDLGRDALSKNAVVVVMGTSDDGKTVEWSRAFTGMPVGNEGLITEVASLVEDVPFDGTLFGRPTYDIKSETIKHTDGLLESILWGTNKFERVSMSSGDADDVGLGFDYLRGEIRPSNGAYVGMGIVNAVLIGMLGFAMVAFTANNVSNSSNSRVLPGHVPDRVRHPIHGSHASTRRNHSSRSTSAYADIYADDDDDFDFDSHDARMRRLDEHRRRMRDRYGFDR